MSSGFFCPITSTDIGPQCSKTGCMHNVAGTCNHQAMVNMEGDIAAVASHFCIDEVEVQRRVRDIQCALVADRWFEHINQVPLPEGHVKHFDAATDPKQAKEFAEWNQSAFNFGQILAMLLRMKAAL